MGAATLQGEIDEERTSLNGENSRKGKYSVNGILQIFQVPEYLSCQFASTPEAHENSWAELVSAEYSYGHLGRSCRSGLPLGHFSKAS